MLHAVDCSFRIMTYISHEMESPFDLEVMWTPLKQAFFANEPFRFAWQFGHLFCACFKQKLGNIMKKNDPFFYWNHWYSNGLKLNLQHEETTWIQVAMLLTKSCTSSDVRNPANTGIIWRAQLVKKHTGRSKHGFPENSKPLEKKKHIYKPPISSVLLVVYSLGFLGNQQCHNPQLSNQFWSN